ncbi:MAG: hypothetical protein M3220_13520 [Chloroflexota bacterium]|nr:hypothetical protein [Chloroflexota bacterium]
MGEGDSFSLYHVDAHRRRVQKQVHHMVVEQVHLVHVEHAPVCVGKHAWLEALLTLPDGCLDVECTDDTILRGTDRQIDHARTAILCR